MDSIIRRKGRKFPITSGIKRRYKETEEGQNRMCEIMERIAKEERLEEKTLINKLNSILIKANRLDDLERSTEDPDYQEQLMMELLPSEMLNV